MISATINEFKKNPLSSDPYPDCIVVNCLEITRVYSAIRVSLIDVAMQPDALDSATTTNQQVIAALFARAPRRIPKLYCSSMIVHMTRQVPFKEQFLRAPDLRLVLRSVSCSLLCGGSLCLFSDEKKKRRTCCSSKWALRELIGFLPFFSLLISSTSINI